MAPVVGDVLADGECLIFCVVRQAATDELFLFVLMAAIPVVLVVPLVLPLVQKR